MGKFYSFFLVALGLSFAVLLSGCGQTGKLYLPPPTSVKTTSKAGSNQANKTSQVQPDNMQTKKS